MGKDIPAGIGHRRFPGSAPSVSAVVLLSAIGIILTLSQIPYIFVLGQADLVQSGAFGTFLPGILSIVSPVAVLISAISLFILLRRW